LSITAKPITVTAATNAKTYDGTTVATATPSVTGGLVGGDTANFTESYSTATAGVGKTLVPSGTVTDGNSGNNYSYTFVNDTTGVVGQAALTITADPKTRAYGDANPTLTVAYSGFVNSETSSVVSGLAINTAANGTTAVGTASIVPSGATATNYNISFVNGTLTITTRNVTFTADAKTKVYGDADPALTYQVTTGTIVNSDTFTGSLTRAAGTNVGTYAISSTLANTNYNITYVGANLSITAKPITVTAATNAKTYDGTTVATATPSVTGGLVGGDTANFTESYNTATAGVGKTLVPSGTVTDGN
jgi:hypothetical protein